MNRRSTLSGVGSTLVSVALLIACLCVDESAQAQKGRRKPPRRAAPVVRCNEMSPSETTDFSGTYVGDVSYPDGGMSGRATLTVTGDMDKQTFTLAPASGETPLGGRLTAETTCKYTAVSLMFGDLTPLDLPPGTPPPPQRAALSLRACKESGGVALRSKLAGKFEFISEQAPPNASGEWGVCNRRWGLQGNN